MGEGKNRFGRVIYGILALALFAGSVILSGTSPLAPLLAVPLLGLFVLCPLEITFCLAILLVPADRYGFLGISGTDAALLVIAVRLAIDWLTGRRSLVRSWICWPLLLILVLNGLSIVIHSLRSDSLAGIRYLLTTVAVVSLPFFAVNLLGSLAELRRALNFLLLGMFVTSLVAIAQGVVFYGFGAFLLPSDHGLHYVLKGMGILRATAFFGDANFFGLFVAPLVGLTAVFALGRASRSRGEYLWLLLCFLAAFLAAVLSFSRGGYVVVIFSLVLAYATVVRKRILALFLVAAPVVYLVLPWVRNSVDGLVRFNPGTIASRVDVYLAAVQELRAHWLLGAGPEKTLFLDTLGYKEVVHNAYLQGAFEGGIFPALGFVVLLAATLWGAVRLAVTKPARSCPEAIPVLALGVALAGTALGASFLGAFYFKPFWLLIGLTAAGVKVISESRPGPDRASVRKSSGPSRPAT